jgi:hypothetical protein
VARFRRARGGGVQASLDDVDVHVLRQVLDELLALLESEVQPESDPLAAALGIGTSTTPPSDPVLARLFPDGYRDDAEAAGEFRRYTEIGLRQAKQDNARTVLASLEHAHGGGKVHLDDAAAQAWLTSLNDLRLAIGTRLEVTEDWTDQYEALAEDDPRRYAYAVYDHLSYLQEGLVQALLGGR